MIFRLLNEGPLPHPAVLSRARLMASIVCWSVTCAAGLGILSPRPSHAVTLTVAPASQDFNRFDVALQLNESPLLVSSDTADLTGTVDAELLWDVVGSDIVLTGVSFTSSQLMFGDVTFNFPLNILTVQGTGLGGSVTTPAPPSTVTAGEFDAADHLLTINQGLFAVSGIVNDNFDISTLPFSGSGMGVGMLDLVEVGRTAGAVTYDVSLTFPVSFEDRVLDTANGDQATMDIDVDGTVLATGQFTAALSAASADFDGDSDVDGADFHAWQRGRGIVQNAVAGDGDADLDGDVDNDDYAIWASQFGATPATIHAAAVPEPATGGLFVLLLGLGGSLRLRDGSKGMRVANRGGRKCDIKMTQM
jgi:hypothetical protein